MGQYTGIAYHRLSGDPTEIDDGIVKFIENYVRSKKQRGHGGFARSFRE